MNTTAAVAGSGITKFNQVSLTNDRTPKTRRKPYGDNKVNERLNKIKNSFIDTSVKRKAEYSSNVSKSFEYIHPAKQGSKISVVPIKNNCHINRYLYETKSGFNKALELFNRSRCFYISGKWLTKGPFFECKGAIRVSQRMCSRCFDSNKLATKTDLYYVDLTERVHNRTILCHGCLGFLLKEEVGCNDKEVKQKLNFLKSEQSDSITFAQINHAHHL